MKQQCAIFLLCLGLLINLQGCKNMNAITQSVSQFTAAVKANPEILNNAVLTNVKLNGEQGKDNGIRLEDITIRNLTLKDVQMMRARLKNVTFIDCTFIKVNLDASTFENVRFLGGSMAGEDRVSSTKPYATSLEGVDVDRVLFDGVFFDKSVRLDLYNGIVVMRNVRTSDNPGGQAASLFLGGENLQVRMDHCTVINRAGLLLSGNQNSIYITNSTITDFLDNMAGGGTVTWVENSTLELTGIPRATIQVVKNCHLKSVGSSALETQTKMYLINNTYSYSGEDKDKISIALINGRKIFDQDSVVYLFGNGTHIPGEVYVDIGHVHIFDTEIDRLYMRQQPFHSFLTSFDLANVTIKSGDWKLGDIRQGTWENVRLYHPIDVKDAKIGTITGHNVRFMDGSPWVNGQVDIVQSPTPLTIDRPPVPTLEELGLAEFWRINDFPPSEHKTSSLNPDRVQGQYVDDGLFSCLPGESWFEMLRRVVGDFCFYCKDWFAQVFLNR